MLRRILAFCTLLLLPLWAQAFHPGRAPFAVWIDEQPVAYAIHSVNLLPGKSLRLRVKPASTPIRVEASLGQLKADSRQLWTWTAPKRPGLSQITLTRADSAQVTLNVFVLVPASLVRDGHLSGYRIGQYPQRPLRNQPVYMPPHGFIEAHPDMRDLRVSPHFTLGQFLCKQQPEQWPKYLLLRPALLHQLELILEEVNRRGIATETLQILSGFRTPWYNAQIENGAYSRHQWGGAADIYIDTTGDGVMDDLNDDGVVDLADSEWLLDLIQTLFQRSDVPQIPGGRGLYGPRPHRGPFVHVDARGWDAFWSVP